MAPPPRPPNKSAWRPPDRPSVPNCPNPADGKTCLHFSIFDRKTNFCNNHIYHFHASESLNLICLFLGEQGGQGGWQKGSCILHVGVGDCPCKYVWKLPARRASAKARRVSLDVPSAGLQPNIVHRRTRTGICSV